MFSKVLVEKVLLANCVLFLAVPDSIFNRSICFRCMLTVICHVVIFTRVIIPNDFLVWLSHNYNLANVVHGWSLPYAHYLDLRLGSQSVTTKVFL